MTRVGGHLSTRSVDFTRMRERNLGRTANDRTDQHGKTSHGVTIRKARRSNSFLHDQPRASSRTNDNHCVLRVQPRLLAGSLSPSPRQTMNTQLKLNVNCHVVTDVYTAPGPSQRKDISPGVADCHLQNYKLKSVKSVSCVTQLSCVNPASNVINAVPNLPVGARLQNFWQTWLNLGAGPKIVQILREGYTLPFRIRPNLTRSPTVVSRYVNPHRNSYLLEALHQLMNKNAVELVYNQTSLGFFNRLFLVPKPNNKWRPILDLSKLNFFLKVEKFKMETPETIRTSLQQGEWVTSVDFKDAYFHIPIQEQSRKYLRFHVQGWTYQFKALLPNVFQQICIRWHFPQIDLFATRFNHKLPQFVSPVPDSLAVAVDALTLPWEDILGKVVEKLLDSPCRRLILIAPGWPNMPWFWDLVNMSSQVPLSLPNLPSLLTQPFNQIPHRNLTNLNLHAWLLRLLKEDQPDQSMRQSGPFLQSGASLIRWTPGHPL